jgi:hypothetical protein
MTTGGTYVNEVALSRRSDLTERFKRAATEEEDEVVEAEPEAPSKRYWVYAPGAGASEFDRFWNVVQIRRGRGGEAARIDS